MTDLTPPPEEPLGDQARARIRAELLESTQDRTPAGRRWAVPAAAAASVVLVAGLTAWATGLGGSDDGVGPADSPSATPTTESTEPGPDTPTSNVDPGPSEPATATPATPNPGSLCSGELEHVLKGAEQVAAYPADDGGTTSYWVKGDRFVLCNERPGRTTVHKPLPLESDLDDRATFRVSSVIEQTGKNTFRTIRVAGGLVPEGALAFDVDYAFPDGHTERATTITDDQGRTWWRMAYAYDAGDGNETNQPPIEVSVSLSGSGFGFTLEWATDTCAQANHGC